MNENVLMENPLALFDDLMNIDDKVAKVSKDEIKGVMDSILNSADYINFLGESYMSNPDKMDKETKKYEKFLERAKSGEFEKEKSELIIYFLTAILKSLDEVKDLGGAFKHIPIRVLRVSEKAILPKYQTKGAAGADIYASVHTEIMPGETKIVPTGLRMVIPGGYEIQIRPRSGLSLKEKISVANAPATIDSDYRGEVGVIIHNYGSEVFKVTEGMRIAQMVLNEIPKISWMELTEEQFDRLNTDRGVGGYGSSGK